MRAQVRWCAVSERCLVVVTRVPGSAGAKTRLVAGIGLEASLRLQGAFMADTLDWAATLAPRRVLAVYPPHEAGRVAAVTAGWEVTAQPERDFGARMRGAVNAGFAPGTGAVAMIATDSPTLPPARIEDAWSRVEGGSVDVALGPADDGGWVLIATAAQLPAGCFSEVRWGGADTLADTEAALRRAGLRTARTEPWYDVDTAADLERLRAELASPATAARLPRTTAELAAP